MPREMKFEIYPSSGQFRWRLKGGNGEIVASGEAYTQKASAQKTIDRIKESASTAEIVDLTQE